MYLSIFIVHHVYAAVQRGPKRVLNHLELATSDWEQKCGSWEQNPGPLATSNTFNHEAILSSLTSLPVIFESFGSAQHCRREVLREEGGSQRGGSLTSEGDSPTVEKQPRQCAPSQMPRHEELEQMVGERRGRFSGPRVIIQK